MGSKHPVLSHNSWVALCTKMCSWMDRLGYWQCMLEQNSFKALLDRWEGNQRPPTLYQRGVPLGYCLLGCLWNGVWWGLWGRRVGSNWGVNRRHFLNLIIQFQRLSCSKQWGRLLHTPRCGQLKYRFCSEFWISYMGCGYCWFQSSLSIVYAVVVVTDSNSNVQLADHYSNCVTDMVVRLHYTNTHMDSRALVLPNMCDSLMIISSRILIAYCYLQNTVLLDFC